ncbi:MAG: arsenate reductase ArsC [Pseudomonadales bacterium]
MTKKLKILFLCTGNSCRSQIAEGWVRHLKGDIIEAHSAGINAQGLNPLAVKVMAEVGVDIANYQSKFVGTMLNQDWDVVITVCGHAHETCPMFSGNASVIHVGFDDPQALAQNCTSEADALIHYRRVRDEIHAFVEALPSAVEKLLPTLEAQR